MAFVMYALSKEALHKSMT